MPHSDVLKRTPELHPHPLQENKLLSCIRLLDVKNLQGLASPLPRSQDLPPECFGAPSSSGDQVISVSHAWRNQAHPDPNGYKTRLLGQILSRISDASSRDVRQHRSIFLFLDFVSIPQRPFRPGQQERTAEEVGVFKRALECMHEMYFYSDRVIHLPWEEADVPGEGVEETLPAKALEGCAFLQIGESVQTVPQQGTSQGGSRASLFDQVVSVDGEVVTSRTQLESLLATDAHRAVVRHYPFGKYSEIPADTRGWVFLERFITMVKCAMMAEDAAKKVVITPSSSILKQIMDGADLLREASLRETKHNKPGELKRVLEGFILELQGKQFSAASTDKREMTAVPSKIDDRAVVSGIMQGFVEHLALHWEAEAAKQRSFGSRLVAVAGVAETYLMEWECFSDEYAARLAAASTWNPWPVAVSILVPLVVAVVPLLWPYASPDASWDSQGEFWGIGLAVGMFICYIFSPTFLARTSKMVYSRSILLLHVGWALLNTTITFAASLSIAAAWRIFPVPLLNFLGAAPLAATLPLLLWCAPKEQRSSRQFRVRLAASVAGLLATLGIFGVAVPLLNAAIPLVSAGWQPLLLSCYLVLKLAFEFFGLKLSKVLGADAMPHFIFVATWVYQLNLCIAFSKIDTWFLAVEQVCFDVLENAYHLYSLFRQDPSERGRERREQYIVASLALREFLEVVAPAVFLVMHELFRAIRPENFALFCNRSEEEVQRTVRFLLVAITTEFLGSCVTCAILRYRQHTPLLLLRGLIATSLDDFVLIGITSLNYYCSMEHAYFGMDLTFRFLWVTEPDSVWRCGLTWEVPAAA